MNGIKILVMFLALSEAGWMAFDGTRALVVGDFVTPKSGEYAGELGPWTHVVSAVGIEPRSTLMKSIFAVHGWAWLAILVTFVIGLPMARPAMIAAAALSLWYLPFGTVFSLIQLVLLIVFTT